VHVALVTGASGGIGAAIAERLAVEGFAVGLTAYSRPDAGKRVRDRIRAAAGKAECFRADVSRESEVARVFDAVHASLGALDVVISNAGVWPRVTVYDMSVADWEQVIATNLRSTFLVCRAAARTTRRAKPASSSSPSHSRWSWLQNASW